jgi:hypothetical protein
MDAGQVAQGLGLGAYGATFYGLAYWYVQDDARLRRMAESRWWVDRHMRKIRTGEMSQAQWYARFARGQRLIVRRFLTPFMVLWLGIATLTTIHGLRSP